MTELSSVQIIAVSILPILFAITLHEVAHGWVASMYGDQTARLMGRLTLNPIKHMDLIGTVIVPLFMLIFSNFIFGWAKPVPVDPRNMRNPRWNMAVVALAGPLSNFIMALLWAIIAKLGVYSIENSPQIGVFLIYSGEVGITVNIVLMVLNLLPFPPLDGSRLLSSVLPPKWAWKLSQIDQYGLLILILLLATGILSYIIGPPISKLMQLIFITFQLPYIGL